MTDGYFDNSGRTDVLSGGVRMIPIDTPSGRFRVWTKRVGNNPTTKLLFLHGGPGFTHEYFEPADCYLPAAGVEYYYYDQLGSFYSDQPDDHSLWEIDRFVDEVEQVRVALGLNESNFFLLGHVPMQGPSELGASGKLGEWDRADDLARIGVPTLVIGAGHDTMDPAHMEDMADRLPKGRYLHCPDGSHMAMYDDQETYFAGLVDFLQSPDR